jgi:hypothetical protein
MLLAMDNTKLSTGMFGIGELNLSPIQSGPVPALKIPLVSGVSASRGIAPATFTRNSTATYIDPNGVLQTAAIDVPRFQNGRYLVELAATNLFLQSGIPETQTITVVSGSVYTVQCFGAGNITLSGAGTGTVVQGTPITFTASSTSLICTVTGSLSMAQVELGPKATSYIPTTSSVLTRAADVLHYDVSSVITQGQGSLYCEFNYTSGTGVIRRIINLSNGTVAERITLYINTINGLQVIGVTGGVTTISTPTVTYATSGNNKLLLTYRDNSVLLYHNGSLAGSDLSGLISRLLTKLYAGVGDGVLQLNSEIGNIKYFKEVLTEAEAIKLTTL